MLLHSNPHIALLMLTPLLALGAAARADCPRTAAQTEGPYFKKNSPLKDDFRPDAPTEDWTHLIVRGRVVGTDCLPLADAKLDFWHADELGEYDNETYRMRGHLFSNACGEYYLDTVVPGLYPGRTRHIHVKLTSSSGLVLTTQLYFPDEERNKNDGLYRQDLEMAIEKSDENWDGVFEFVMNLKGNAADCRSSGDMNCDGALDFTDIDGFVMALLGETEYREQYRGCAWLNGDMDRDGDVDFDDIDPFVACLIDGGCE